METDLPLLCLGVFIGWVCTTLSMCVFGFVINTLDRITNGCKNINHIEPDESEANNG